MWTLALLLTLTSQGLALSHFEVKGYVQQNILLEEATLQEVAALLESKIKDQNFFIKRVKYGEMGSSLHTFLAYFSTDSSLEEFIKNYGEIELFKIVFWREIEVNEIPPRPVLLTPTECENGGTKLPNSTCACGPFTTGANCEKVSCQRKGIVEGDRSDRCYCPPGWYAEFCEIRGCRPPLNDNLNVDTRSFLLVLPVTPSMVNVRNTLIDNLSEALNDLNSQERGWLGTYLLDMFVQVDDANFVSYLTVATNATTLVNNLKNTTITAMKQPAKYPIMQSLVNIQQYSREMNPNSIIFVFTDAPDKDATSVSYTINDNTLELQATQTTMLWRNRAYIFYIRNSTNAVNYTSDSYDTYRRMVTFSHGELFVINENEIKNILSHVLTKLYRPEYVDVRSYAQCGDLLLDLARDDNTHNITVFITIDQNPNTPSNVTISASNGINETILAESNGPLWAVFVVPAGWLSLKVSVSPNTSCSARAFLSSKATLLWAYSDDDYIDVGNCMNLAEMPMMITLQPVNFPTLTSAYVEFTNDATNNPFTWPMSAIVRQEADCTFDYKIPDLPRCAAGPYTQKYTLINAGNSTIRRIHPGFCSHGAKNNGTDPIVAQYPTKGNGSNLTCYLINPADMGGKLHDFRQIIFAIEIAKEMQLTINTLINMIGEITNIIFSQDSYKRQFTLVTFNSSGWKGIASDYDPVAFATKFKKYLTPLLATALPKSNGAFSMDAIYHAVELKIISPAQIHVFTISDPKASNYYWVLPTDVQVNFFYMDPSVIIPAHQDFHIMQKQTGGRLITLSEKNIQLETFTTSIYQNNLIFDTTFQACSANTIVQVPIEKSIKTVEFTFIGNMSAYLLTIYDGKNTTLNTGAKAFVISDSPSSLVLQYNSSNYMPGVFRISFSTIGSCSIQVRAISDINVAVGFTSDLHDDFPSHHPFNRRGTTNSAFVVVRATGLSNILSVVVSSADVNAPWKDGSIGLNTSDITKYDENTCAYQYRTNSLMMPISDAIKITVIGQENNSNLSFQRVFYYYTPAPPSPTNVAPECNGGKVNQYGECSCEEYFTGEYCWDRVCAYGSTPSRGICMCWSYYYGERCENVRYNISTATEPPFPPSTTTVMPSTTQKSANIILTLSVLMLIGLLSF